MGGGAEEAQAASLAVQTMWNDRSKRAVIEWRNLTIRST
jgi:hypothetical protein